MLAPSSGASRSYATRAGETTPPAKREERIVGNEARLASARSEEARLASARSDQVGFALPRAGSGGVCPSSGRVRWGLPYPGPGQVGFALPGAG
ncbi:hypothetical protein KM043_000236, partial [Ampulex compressa]